jgi:hypothetical protein
LNSDDLSSHLNNAPKRGHRKRELGLVEYITRKTGMDESTVLKVLNAEEEFFILQVEEALKKKSGGAGV